MKRVIFAAFSGFFLSIALPAGAQTVDSRVKADSLKIGDVIHYTLVVNKDKAYDQILLPDSSEFAPEFEIRSKRVFQPTPQADSVVYELQFFGTKDSFVPNVPVGFVAGADTSYVLAEKAPFVFKSLLAKEEEPSFKPMKPIFAFAMAWWPILAGVLIAIIVGYFGYKWYKARQAAKAAKPPEIKPFIRFDNPIFNLEEEIRAIRDSKELSTGDFKMVYSRLGDAIRRYFEQVYKFPALEETTGEVIRDLRRYASDVRLLDMSNKLLRAADMVKFAKFEPAYDQVLGHLSQADELAKVLREVDGPSIHRMQLDFESAQLPKQQEAGK